MLNVLTLSRRDPRVDVVRSTKNRRRTAEKIAYEHDLAFFENNPGCRFYVRRPYPRELKLGGRTRKGRLWATLVIKFGPVIGRIPIQVKHGKAAELSDFLPGVAIGDYLPLHLNFTGR